MEITAATLLLIFAIIGFIMVFFSSWGTLLIMLGAAVFSFVTNFQVIDVKTLVILFILYLAGEVLEYIFIILIAKKLGASNIAVAGAIVGGILGAIFGASFLGVGTALGILMGLFLGAFMVELLIQRDLVKSLKAGLGSVLGRLLSIATKIAIAAVMILIIAAKTGMLSKILPKG